MLSSAFHTSQERMLTAMRKPLLRTICRRIIFVCLLTITACVLPAAADTAPTKVVLGTATKGGGFQLFGQNLAEVINAADPTLHIEELATKGSKQNLPFLEEGKIDIGLVEGNAARQALDGIGRPAANLKVLSVMYPNPGMFVVLADSPYKSIDDLKGHPVAFGTRASGLRILAGDVLDGLGLQPDQDFKQIILDKAADGPRLVLEKEVVALWGAGIGWPGFVKVANGPAGGRFIAPAPEQIQKILNKHPHLKPMAVPAGTYKGQKADINSVGLWSLILVRPDLPDEVVYRLARAIHKGGSSLGERLKQGIYTTAQNTVDQVSASRLHPGAATYYREIGLLTKTAR
jgi:TRAP transporter TAXI family solute receptor